MSEAPPQRKRESEVIAAAIEVFYEKGFAAASVADVGDRVGMLKGSLYYYIDSKEDLLMRIFQKINVQAMDIVDEVAVLEVSALDRLRAYVERYVLWYLENVELVSIYFTEWRHLTGDRRAEVRRHRKAFEGFIQGLVAEARHAGDIDDVVDPAIARNYVLGAINSVSTWYRRDGGMSAEEISTSYAELVIRSLSTPA